MSTQNQFKKLGMSRNVAGTHLGLNALVACIVVTLSRQVYYNWLHYLIFKSPLFWSILIQHTYNIHSIDTAQLKLDTRFWLLVSVHRFYLSPSSIIACYLRVTLIVSRIWFASGGNWLLHESQYEPPYEFLGGNTSISLDKWNKWFPPH